MAASPPAVSHRLLLVSSNSDLGDRLRQASANRPLIFDTVPTPEAAQAVLPQSPPDLLVLDLAAAPEAGLALLTTWAERLPVVVLTGHDRLIDRVEVARLGSQALLPHHTPAAQVLAAVDKILARQRGIEAKAWLLTAEPAIAETLQTLMAPWGIEIATADDPEDLWAQQDVDPPDLLLVDRRLRSFDGLDLCRVLRNDPVWGDLPLLVLTDDAAPAPIAALFDAGADDYIRLPLVPPEAIARILGTLRRRFPRYTGRTP
ncbi:MAG: response regulator [Oscillatoriales cyanobacterium SM2_1_8]|nr:response regulator [Oscillatoriales cyanobacterium SM2_1_8]